MCEKKSVVDLDVEIINALARKSALVRRRSRKISPCAYLCALCRLAVKGSVSFNDMAGILGLTIGQAVSKQAVWKRTTVAALNFLRAILELQINKKTRTDTNRPSEIFKYFKRVVLQDSTCVKLSKKHVENFPGIVNQYSRASNLKIQTAYDLKAGRFVEFQQSAFSKNDQKASPDILAILHEGDLLIRDLGYFVMNVFRKLSENKIFFLSRLRFKTSLFCPVTGAKINLLNLLKKKGEADMNVLMGKEKVPVRLVATRVPEQIGAGRRRKAASEKDKRFKHSKEYYKLMDWNIYITNVPPEIWNTQDVNTVYSARWRIETIFKAWKSNMCLEHIHQNISEKQIFAIILARMIICVHFLGNTLNNILWDTFEQTGRFVSMLKLARLFQNNPDSIMLPTRILSQVIRTCCLYEQRKRKNFMTRMSET